MEENDSNEEQTVEPKRYSLVAKAIAIGFILLIILGNFYIVRQISGLSTQWVLDGMLLTAAGTILFIILWPIETFILKILK